MGYTHYWYRDKEIEPRLYEAIVDDFNKLVPIPERQGQEIISRKGCSWIRPIR